jgi:hypothetical protein
LVISVNKGRVAHDAENFDWLIVELVEFVQEFVQFVS